VQYLCLKANTKYPILPIHTKEEKRYFRSIIAESTRPLNSSDYAEIARKWNDKADGKDFFYKLPEHISKYKNSVFDRVENSKNSVKKIAGERLALRKNLAVSEQIIPQPPLRTVQAIPDNVLQPRVSSTHLQENAPIVNHINPVVIEHRVRPMLPRPLLPNMMTVTESTNARVLVPLAMPTSVQQRMLPKLQTSLRKRKRCLNCEDPSCNGGYKKSVCLKLKNQ
jgi:hypothetical protein